MQGPFPVRLGAFLSSGHPVAVVRCPHTETLPMS